MKQVMLGLLATLILWVSGASPGLAFSQDNTEEIATMSVEYQNIDVLQKFDPRNVNESADILAEDVVWHFFNPLLPDVQGDYVGLTGLQSFFEEIGRLTNGTFEVTPISASPVGSELVVVHTRNAMIFEDRPVETDVVIVWRLVGGRITEVWDIPSVYTLRDSNF